MLGKMFPRIVDVLPLSDNKKNTAIASIVTVKLVVESWKSQDNRRVCQYFGSLMYLPHVFPQSHGI